MDSPRRLVPSVQRRHRMKKLVRLFVFLVVTGMTAACGSSPMDLGDGPCEVEGVPIPNGFCE